MSKLILLDLDDTIVDTQTKINDLRLAETIQTKIDEGWEVGLNSDTPLKRLQVWWQSLHMNGPIIAEKGAIVWWPDMADRDGVMLSETAHVFSSFRQKAKDLFNSKGYLTYLGDSTYYLRSVGKVPVNSDHRKVFIAIDEYRQCSLGLFCRKITESGLVPSERVADEVYDLLASIRPKHPLISSIDLNYEYGFLSVNALDASKTKGVQALFERSKPEEVIMIGNSMSDYIDLPEVRHCAVGNAEEAFKRRANLTARSHFAEGCVELLSRLSPVSAGGD